MDKIQIIVATHKPYIFPQHPIYTPIQVGASLYSYDLGIFTDKVGNNISEKNPSFCELTALYWAWKNGIFEKNNYVGLVHYRRYFSGHEIRLNNKQILGEKEIAECFKEADCIVPKKRNYYIESVYSHYKNAHYINDLDEALRILIEKNPEYQTACNHVMNGKTLHLFNMFIMKSELCEQYCEWLFPLLFKLEEKLDISTYNTYQKRVFGFIAERLFNIWLVHNNIQTKQIKIVNLEKESLLTKAFYLLKRKFLRRPNNQ